ncbi:MAG: bifunctional riboflavin kinase/FAD synthetase [bacterium]
MEVIRDLGRSGRRIERSVVTVGNFDGVHRGHQQLFARVRSEAARFGAPAVVYTFDPHPQQVLRPDKAPEILTALPKRVRLIRDCGMDLLICEHFTREFAALEPEVFIRSVLLEQLGATKVIIGYDFCFGRACRGTPQYMQDEAPRFGLEAEVFPAFQWKGDVVSSTRIRRLLKAGDVRLASELLGRYFLAQGHVVSGNKRGRVLGFPTANLAPPDELLPKAGVYAVWVEIGEAIVPGVANVGVAPTFGGETLSVEAHLLDFDGDLYGQAIGVRFVDRIRDERKFGGVAELTDQIRNDVERARALLASAGTTPSLAEP